MLYAFALPFAALTFVFGLWPIALSGELRQDGWVGGYSELQGHSNAFATWFRWIGIAMADQYLWPGRRDWHFRPMIGIGYRRPNA